MFGFLARKDDNDIVNEVSSIYRDQSIRSVAQSYGLSVNSVTWEDTARTKGSSWRTNISDLTLCLTKSHTNLPVFRKNNFADH
jgi:transposase-like protein